MQAQRYVVIGLAHVRSSWFADVARWATSGAIPVEFVKCVSVEELRARLTSGRPFSAALLDARLPAVDRDLLAGLTDRNVASLVVTAPSDRRDWLALGAAMRLRTDFSRTDLLDALSAHGRLIDPIRDSMRHDGPPAGGSTTWRSPLVAVCARSGAGGSTITAALAQRLAADPRYGGDVVLVDLARRAHQAVLHDARDVMPGIQEVIEAHRTGRPGIDDLRRLTFDVPARSYHLVLGLRQPRDWVTVRSQAFAAALDGLRRIARLVVADTDADLEGEATSGSHDIEDRHLLGRATTAAADVVVVVTTPSLTGLHGVAQHLEELRGHGVPGERLLVVVNRAPRSPKQRAELTRVVATITGAGERPDPHVGPVFVPERRGIDALHRDLARFPAAIADPVGVAVLDLLTRLPERSADTDLGLAPVPIVPGTLGSWHDDA